WVVPNAKMGLGSYLLVANGQVPTRLKRGIRFFGKRSVIPGGERLGRNVRGAENVRAADFRTKVVRSGGSVDRRAGASEEDERPARRVPAPRRASV
ncbi:MAG: hypothetical protein ACHQ02_05900, partial [Candidatus Limnocylindrales bacterium]